MKCVKVRHYDAFTALPNRGNPAGIVLGGEALTDEEMQSIAQKVGFNESAFPLPSQGADLKIRFFSPGSEMDLCGHATMATLYALKTRGALGEKETLTIETGAGILPIRLTCGEEGAVSITMEQAAPQFCPFDGSREEIAAAIGLTAADLDDTMPMVYGSTGAWTLLVPIKGLEPFERMRPDNQRFPQLLTKFPRASVHPFCLDTRDPGADMHARHFSSPFAGTVEDPVTGTASGVMGAYFAQYLEQDFSGSKTLVVEQGLEIGLDGRVTVHVSGAAGKLKIAISGTAVFVKEFEVAF